MPAPAAVRSDLPTASERRRQETGDAALARQLREAEEREEEARRAAGHLRLSAPATVDEFAAKVVHAVRAWEPSLQDIVNYDLAVAFLRRMRAMLAEGGPRRAKLDVVYHWTPEQNFVSIERGNLQVPGRAADVFHQTDEGYYGKGIYTSPRATAYTMYGKGAKRCILCLCLAGRQYPAQKAMGRALQKGYDSHTNGDSRDGVQGSQWVFFSSDQLLPLFLLDTATPDLQRCERVARRLIGEAEGAPAFASARQRYRGGDSEPAGAPAQLPAGGDGGGGGVMGQQQKEKGGACCVM